MQIRTYDSKLCPTIARNAAVGRVWTPPVCTKLLIERNGNIVTPNLDEMPILSL